MTVELPAEFETFLLTLDTAVGIARHLSNLRTYMSGGGYTGAVFQTLTVEGNSPNHLDVSDLAALWTLSVPLEWEQSRALLVEHEKQISALLADLPDRPLASLSNSEVEELHSDDSPAMSLWRRIRGVDGIGPVRTSKLMARKRPHLIPIYDTFVKSVLGLKSDALQWRVFHEAFSRNNRALESQLLKLGDVAGHPELSALRVFDIIVWMHKRVGENWGQK